MKKLWQDNKAVIKFTLLIFLLWQVFLARIIFLGEQYIPSSYQYIYTEQRVVNPQTFWSRANFDGTHYLDIARKGYGIYQQAFFPLYPSLIRWSTPLFRGRDLMVGLGISMISLFWGLVLLIKLIKLDYSEEIARWTVVFFLIFPTAFFLSMVYTESLFLFLVLASFYFARTRKWWWAGVFGALASATRLAGIFLFPALLVEWWQQGKIKNEKLKMKNCNLKFKITQLLNYSITQLLFLFFIPLGLLWYMRYLAAQYGDPFMFLHVQPFFGAERLDKIILLYQVFWRYAKMLWTVQKASLTYFVVVLEFLAGTGFLALLILGYRKKIRLSYLVFAGFSYLAPTLTGTFSSMPRYVLTLFPCFIMIALIKNKVIKSALLAVSFLLLIICTILFTRGYWIA